MSFELIVTLGPSLKNSEKLNAISKLGPCIFRINGAHSGPEQIGFIVSELREVLPQARVMVDLPGNKIRTHNLDMPIRLTKGEMFEIADYQVNFPDFYKHLKAGDIIHANDNIYYFEVKGIKNKKIKLLSHSDGVLQTNKGLHVNGIHKDIPFLFQRDMSLIKAGVEARVNNISLSFVRNEVDVQESLEVLDKLNAQSIEIFVKIETQSALENLNKIIRLVQNLNIDRGDLSADIGLLNLPAAILNVVEVVKKNKKNIFLATQFLKNMELQPTPLLSEVVDMYRAFQLGINGIQLSEETAVGKYPVECVKFTFDMHKQALKS